MARPLDLSDPTTRYLCSVRLPLTSLQLYTSDPNAPLFAEIIFSPLACRSDSRRSQAGKTFAVIASHFLPSLVCWSWLVNLSGDESIIGNLGSRASTLQTKRQPMGWMNGGARKNDEMAQTSPGFHLIPDLRDAACSFFHRLC